MPKRRGQRNESREKKYGKKDKYIGETSQNIFNIKFSFTWESYEQRRRAPCNQFAGEGNYTAAEDAMLDPLVPQL